MHSEHFGLGVDALPALRAGSAFFGGPVALASAVVFGPWPGH